MNKTKYFLLGNWSKSENSSQNWHAHDWRICYNGNLTRKFTDSKVWILRSKRANPYNDFRCSTRGKCMATHMVWGVFEDPAVICRAMIWI